MKKKISILISLFTLALFSYITIPGLSKEASIAFGIFFASLIMWIGVSIDWPSILTIFAIGLLPSIGFSKALTGAFGNSTVLFLLFTFMIVYPLSKTNFIRRVTLFFISNNFAKKGPWHFAIFLFLSIFLLGLFISPSVLFVAFMPFLQDIYDVLNVKKGSKFGNMLMMGSAFIISLSSGATPIGHVWPTLAMSAYAGATGKTINVFSYMIFGITTAFILFVILIIIFALLYKPDVKNIRLNNVTKLKNNKLGRTSKKEAIILATLVLVILLWIVPSFIKEIYPNVYNILNSLTTAMPPMLGCIILFLFEDEDNKPILEFSNVMKNGVLWGAIFMTAAATLVGTMLTNDNIGISKWISDAMLPVVSNLNSGLIVLFFVTWTIIETNFSSNIVTTTVVTSIAILVFSTKIEYNLAAICSLIGFGAGICNMTPAGQSTINTVAISSGYTNTKSMFIWGGAFAIFSIIVLSSFGYYLLNLML